MNPGSASLPVVAISRSLPIVSRIRSHSASVRWSFHRIAGTQDPVVTVEGDEPMHLTGEPHRLDCPRRGSPTSASTLRIARDRAVPPELRILFAPQRPRRLERYSGHEAARTSPPASRITAFVAVVDTSRPRTWLIASSPARRRIQRSRCDRHALRRHLSERTERLELAEVVADEHLDRRAEVRVRTRSDRCRRASRTRVRSVDTTRVPGWARRRSSAAPRATASTPELVRAQVQTSVAGVGVRPEHQRAVGLRPRRVRRGRYDDLAAERELRDRPRRQGDGGAGTVADVVIDDPSGLGPAHLDRS